MVNFKVDKKNSVVIAYKKNKNVSVKSVAKCNLDEDVFDEEIGKKIAREKVDKKFAVAKKTFYIKQAESFLAQANFFYNMAELIDEGKPVERKDSCSIARNTKKK